MKSPFAHLPEEAWDDLVKDRVPEWTAPMLATLVKRPFSDPDWIYERKLDGMRILAFRKGGGDVRLMSRNRKERGAAYPEVAEALGEVGARDFVVDGEVVAFQGNVTSFERLQGRMHLEDPEKARASGVAVYYYVFDLLHLDGYDVTRVALRHRKGLLRRAITFRDPIRLLPHRNEEGVALFRQACAKGWEGLIAKDARSPYLHERSRDWLKFKCVHEQELVIGGWTDPEGERVGFGALLLGYYEGRALRYAGKVGTGFDEEVLRSLHDRLESLARKTAPFAGEADLPTKGVHWVTPELVCEVGFTEWTDEGKLRHPRYLGLRDDKDADEVVQELPA